jgi:hypothetical protein
MTAATFNYSDPTPEMLENPVWNAIWDEIKTWDINVPTEYSGYDVTGNHATAIYKAIQAVNSHADLVEALQELILAARGLVAEAYIRDAQAALAKAGEK